MHLGLSIEKSLISAAIVTNGGDFVWQKSYPVAEDGATSFLTSCSALVDMASRDKLGLNQAIGISAQRSFNDQPTPHDGLGGLAPVELQL